MPTVILYNPKEKVTLKVPYLPCSLMSIGTSLKKSGCNIIIIDGRIERHTKRLIAAALEQDPVLFGITMMTGSMIYDALEIARFVKTIKPNLKIAAGGVHPSMRPEETVRHPLLDYVIIGPGEKSTIDLVRCLEAGTPIDHIAGLAFKEDGAVVLTPRALDISSDCFSGVDYHLVELKRYIKRESTGQRCLDYLSSRGCPHRCSYCAIAELWGRKMIIYPSHEMAETIHTFVKDLGVDAIHFLDDNFFVNKERVETFCDEIIRRNINIQFWATCRINYFANYDEAFLRKIKQAGFHTINFGAESGSQFILNKIKKEITVEQILSTAHKCQKYGFRGQFSFMTAFPFETKEDTEKTMALIEKIHSINKNFDCQLFPFIPFPGTDLFHECQKNGVSFPEALEDWGDFEYGKKAMPWLSNNEKKRIDTLTTIAWFGFTSETAVKLGGLKGWIFRLMGKIARLRWKHRFFKCPWEWKLINYLTRR